MEEKVMLVSLDRIEEGIAVLLTRESHRWLMKADFLPEGTAEGDVLKVLFERDPVETSRQAERIRELRKRLLDRTRERRDDA